MFRSEKACVSDLTVLGGYKRMRGKWLYSVDGGNTILEGIIA